MVFVRINEPIRLKITYLNVISTSHYNILFEIQIECIIKLEIDIHFTF